MATRRQATSRKWWPADPAPLPSLTAADASHRDVPSPAMLLQNRVGAALAAAEATHVVDPFLDKWPAATRLVILFAGAISSWVLVWQVAKYLI